MENHHLNRKKRVLTGIKPTGTAHLGNLFGAIRPAISMSLNPDFENYYFLADYHGLTTVHDPTLFRTLTYELAATWLALGLDVEKTTFFRQSDVPEVFELNWIFACFTSKGLMNRAHAYKSFVDSNLAKNHDPDQGVNMGIYTYPILMAADILMYGTDLVPIGADQVQHVEIARDIAEAFHARYAKGNDKDKGKEKGEDKGQARTFVLPNAVINKDMAVIPGTDGRKMSKSYNNTIEVFLPEKKLRQMILKIKTDSSSPTDPKDPDKSILFQIYAELASETQKNEMRRRFVEGIGWGEVKVELYEVLNAYLSAPREKYLKIVNDHKYLEEVLQAGAVKARAEARERLGRIREAIGLNR
jgi:tryptophanyl-tRNA synthetase